MAARESDKTRDEEDCSMAAAQAITWLEDLEAGRRRATQEHKILFVDFYKTPG